MIMLKDKALVALFGLITVMPLAPQASTTDIPTLVEHDIILLGERHDHPDHHENQAKWLDRIASAGKTSVVMEMVSMQQLAQLGDKPQSSNAWKEALNWDEQGWPDFDLYRPIFDVVTKHNLTILAGTMSIRPGTALGKRLEVMQQLAGQPPQIPDQIKTQLAEDVRVGHCNLLPEEMIAPMVEIQWFKDAFMAKQLTDSLANATRAVLIAGNGHTQGDTGVPIHLRDAKLSVLAIVQQEGDQQGYGGKDDTIIITREIPMDDPCKSLQERFGKKQN